MPTHLFLLERLNTPLDQMLIVTDAAGNLRALDWNNYEDRMHRLLRQQYKNDHITISRASKPSTAREAIERYFEGELTATATIPVATGGTEFQRLVWKELRAIPQGETISYATLATRIQRPLAVRAVGAANGSNPIGIVVPCHRVIGSNQSLTGYGGGLERKKWLLEHEQRWLREGKQ